MGFQGTLDSVNLGDIFQTLSVNQQTGTLVVTGTTATVSIWCEQGAIALINADVIDGIPTLIRLLQCKSLLSPAQVQQLLSHCKNTQQQLRELILASGFVNESDLDAVAQGYIEDQICDIFEWNSGDFTFTDGGPLDYLSGIAIVELGHITLQTAGVVMEATRRHDEWERIREVLPESDELFVVDNEGRTHIADIDTDPEMLKVLRYIDGKHKLDEVARLVGISRFDTHAIVAQLLMAGIARTRSSQEIVNDALELRTEEKIKQASSLLDNALTRVRIAEVLLPLADISVELQDYPKAIGLYLELAQTAQDDGDFEKALDFLDTVIDINPDDPELRLDRATILVELERMDEASEGYLDAAQDYLGNRDTDAAIECCHLARDMKPSSSEPHRILAKSYLMSGQTDNAVVEYKSLWHALLSTSNPRAALKILVEILDDDCKYPSITEQVLNHAKGSESVKTTNAMRLLFYAATIILVLAASWFGYQQVQNKVIKENVLANIQNIDHKAQQSDANFRELLDQLERIDNTQPDVVEQRNAVDTRIRTAYARAGEALAINISERLSNNDFSAETGKQVRKLSQEFNGILPPERINGLSDTWELGHARKQIANDLQHIHDLWNQETWNEAIAELQSLISTETSLPKALTAELEKKLVDWKKHSTSAESLFRRAERIENKRGKEAAIEAFLLALEGEGQRYRDNARERLILIENSFAEQIAKQANLSFHNKDTEQAFLSLDNLEALANKAHGEKPTELFRSFMIPYTLTLNHPDVTVTIMQAEKATTISAPATIPDNGKWTHSFSYRHNEMVTITAKRLGFTDQQWTVDRKLRSLGTHVTLERGQLWQTTLPAPVTSALQSNGENLVAALNNNSLAVIDPALGAFQNVSIGESVGSFIAQPMIFRSVAYITLSDRIHAIDLNTRQMLWSYPEDDTPFPQTFAGAAWAQENDLIAGEIQIFAVTKRGTVLTISVQSDLNNNNTITRYPDTVLETGITGPALGYAIDLSSTVYVPAGNLLMAFDTATVSPTSELSQLYAFETRGDITCHPIPTNIAGQKAFLVVDSSGYITAIDANPENNSNGITSLGSWPLGTGSSISHPPVVLEGKGIAIAPLDAGQLVALALDTPGKLAWRYPQTGTLATIVGSPSIGTQGTYVVDSNGILTCLETETGRKRWDFDLGAPAAAGVFAHNGRIFIPTKNNILHCFDEGSE